MNADGVPAPAPFVGVVVNPERPDDDIVDHLERVGCRVSIRTPATPGALASAVDELVAEGVDVVAAVGGDGTQRTTAASLIGTDVALAVVPGGTVNLLANVVGTGEVGDVAEAVVAGHTRRIDLARIDDDVFVLNASTGLDASVIGSLDDRHKRFGRLGITFAGIREWARTTTRHVTVDANGARRFRGPAHSVLVMNVGNRASAAFQLAPDASIDDGRLDVLVFRRHSVAGLTRAIWAALRGRDMPRHEVEVMQAAELTVTWAEAVDVQFDGDPRPPATTTRYESLPGALRVVTAPS